jgi:hypothetical protein
MRPVIVLFAILLFSCNNKTRPEEKSEALKEKEREAIDKSYASADFNGCFWKIMGRDTLAAWLAQTENTITGKLNFDNFEKDGSSGTVHGTLEGDIVKLWYTFESEGMKSIMEVWFKKQGDSLIRGTGPSKARADSSYFADTSKVSFNNSQVLQKTDCSNLPAKYK